MARAAVSAKASVAGSGMGVAKLAGWMAPSTSVNVIEKGTFHPAIAKSKNTMSVVPTVKPVGTALVKVGSEEGGKLPVMDASPSRARVPSVKRNPVAGIGPAVEGPMASNAINSWPRFGVKSMTRMVAVPLVNLTTGSASSEMYTGEARGTVTIESACAWTVENRHKQTARNESATRIITVPPSRVCRSRTALTLPRPNRERTIAGLL